MTQRTRQRRFASLWLVIAIALASTVTLFAGSALPAFATDSGTCTFSASNYNINPGGGATVVVTRTNTAAAGDVTISMTNSTNVFSSTFNATTINFALGNNSAVLNLPNASLSASIGAQATMSLGSTTDCSVDSSTATLTVTSPGAPTVGTVSPNNGSVSGGTAITITGTNFFNPASVMVGSNAATDVIVLSPTSITATTPAGTAGPANVVVTINSVGSGTSGNAAFTYVPNTPTITSLSATTGPAGAAVTITGTNFVGGCPATVQVYYGSNQANCTVYNSTTIYTTVPAGSGTVQVHVHTANGDSNTVSFTYGSGAAPVITNVNPSTGPVGQLLTITGTNLTPATVTVGGVNCPVNAVASNSTTVYCTTAGGVTQGVAQPVSLNNGVATFTAPAAFTYTNSSPVTVTGVIPNSCTTAGGGTLTVNGTGFLTGYTTVALNGVAASNVNVISANQLTVTCPPQLTTGTFDLIVTVSSVSSPANLVTDGVTYITSGLAPIISSLSPTSGPTSGGTTVAITGANFSNPVSVYFDGIPATSATATSTTSIQAVTPAHTGTGLVNVIVTTAGGSVTDSYAFTYINSNVPVVTGVSPVSGPAGTVVTITGSNFTGTTGVTFGGIAATTFTFVSDTSITATVPSSAPPGVIDVIVTNASGPSANTTADNFNNTSNTLITIVLQGRFTLIGWVGLNNISVADALRGGPNGAQNGTNDITSKVSVVWGFNTATQTWQGYFPGATNPGANDLTNLQAGSGYFIALIDPTTPVSWTFQVVS